MGEQVVTQQQGPVDGATAGEVVPEPRTTSFGGVTIRWDERVLEPRPWTTAQSRWAAQLADEAPDGPILELCCGAGQIGLLTAVLTGREIVQVDRDAVARGYARANAEAAGLVPDVRDGDVRAAPAAAAYALVIADPPWVPSDQVGLYPEDPLTAIDGGADGGALAAACLEHASGALLTGGHLVLQVGTTEQVTALRAHPVVAEGRMELREVQEHPRGVLVHLVRG